MAYKTYKSLDRKSISEWLDETRRQAQFFRDKYEKSLYKPITGTIPFFRQSYNTYLALSEVLAHIKNGSWFDKKLCLACQFNPPHRNKLEQDFQRFKPLLCRTIDGKMLFERN